MPTVKFAIPKGSIEEVTFNLLEQAWQHVSGRGRTYRVKLGDPAIDVKIPETAGDPHLCSGGLL